MHLFHTNTLKKYSYVCVERQFIRNVPLNTDFNFERLFFSNQSATNSKDFPGNRQSSLRGPAPLCQLRSDKLVTCLTRKTRSYFRFAPPPYPRDKTVSNHSPSPGSKGWTCPEGCPGGGDGNR